MTIWTLKLSSGEELIGKFIGEDLLTVTMEEIKVVVPASDPDGGLSIRTYPWILTSMKEQHAVKKAFVISECETDEKIAAQYIKETTGLILYK